jgi:LysM repeat protein
MPDRVRTYCPLNSLAGQVEQVMNRRRTCVAGVFATLLLLVPTGCRVQIVDDAPPTVVPATAIATPFSIPSSTLPLVPSDGPTPSPPPDSRPAPAEPSSSGSSSAEYTVQPGDTLLGIATTHGVPMAAIQLENDMGESILVQAGQVLVIPPPEDWQEASRFWIVHVVKAAETLGGIARTYGLKTAEIKAVNQMTDPDLIVVGQELVIPLGAPVAEQVSSPAVAPTSLPAPTHTPASLIPSPMPTPSLSPAPIASAIPSTPPTSRRCFLAARDGAPDQHSPDSARAPAAGIQRYVGSSGAGPGKRLCSKGVVQSHRFERLRHQDAHPGSWLRSSHLG